MKNFKYFIRLYLLLNIALWGCQKNDFNVIHTSEDTSSRVYYVSPTGSDSNTGLSQTLPFQSISKAVGLTRPGDIVYLMNGVFNITSTINIGNSGTSDKYIKIAALPGSNPKIVVSGAIFDGIVISGSYIKFEGIEMQGNNANLNLTAAMAAYTAANAGGSANGLYNTNALEIGGPNAGSKIPLHVEVRNCIIHDFPAAGISAITADYITIEGNITYNNSWYTMYGTSGITVLNPNNSDNYTGYKIFIRNNRSYANKTQVPVINDGRITDGNGIIVDVNIYPRGQPTGAPYMGRTLVENNICMNNGGSGIHAFKAGHVDMVNNTVYNNGLVTSYSDMYASNSNDVKIMNNICYSRPGGSANSIINNTNVVYDYNIYFNCATILGKGPNDIVADPQFVNLSTDPAVANFQLKSTSPAVNSGTSTIFSALDFLGVSRPKGSAPDRGAFESF